MSKIYLSAGILKKDPYSFGLGGVILVTLLISFFWFSLVINSYELWQNGVQKKATLISIENVNRPFRGNVVSYYKMEIDGESIIRCFCHSNNVLIEGLAYDVLVAGNNNRIILGHEDDGLLKIFIAQCQARELIVYTITYILIVFFALRRGES